MTLDVLPQPASAGQWKTVHVGPVPYLAHLQAELWDVDKPADISPTTDPVEMARRVANYTVKWVAVIYPHPDLGAQYVRGESFESMDVAISEAAGLLEGGSGSWSVLLPDSWRVPLGLPPPVGLKFVTGVVRCDRCHRPTKQLYGYIVDNDSYLVGRRCLPKLMAEFPNGVRR